MSDNIISIKNWLERHKIRKDASDLDIIIYNFISDLKRQGLDVHQKNIQKDIIFIIKFIESLYKRHKGEKSVLHEMVDEWFDKNPDFFLKRP